MAAHQTVRGRIGLLVKHIGCSCESSRIPAHPHPRIRMLRCTSLTLLAAAAVAAADTAAPVVRNWGFGVRRDATTELTAWALRASDETAAATGLTYTLVAAPAHGELRRLGAAIAASGTFTQDDIDQGRIAYRHAAGAGDAFDRLVFTVSDGVNATAPATLEISVGAGLRVQKVGEAKVGEVDPEGGVAEIVAFDAASRRLFVVNGATASINILALSSSGSLGVVGTLRPSLIVPAADDITSVACGAGIVAAVVGNAPTSDDSAGGRGYLFFYDAATGLYLNHIDFATDLRDAAGGPVAGPLIGVQPDMVAFTPDGGKALVAIEGQPSQDYTVDPHGGVIVVDLSAGVLLARSRATWCGFDAFDTAALRDAGVRIFNDAAGISPASAAADLEPEFIAVAPDGRTAYVTCQENNAIAVLDLAAPGFTAVLPLGTKDWSTVPMDASNEDGGTNTNSGSPSVRLAQHPVSGLYMPDGIAAGDLAGTTYLFTANEGDAREYAAYVEEARIRSAGAIDPLAYPDAANPPSAGKPLTYDSNLGRLKISLASSDGDGDGDIDRFHAFGARSFSVWTTAGALVWDSGAEFESFFAAYFPDRFNVSNDDNAMDSRSDDKGPEPEGVALLRAGATTFAAIGLERQGGFFLYDVTAPAAPAMVAYYTGRHYAFDPGRADEADLAGDLAPEGILTVPAAASPTGHPLVIVGNEVSGTVAVHEVVLAAGDGFSGSGAGMGGGPGTGGGSGGSSGDAGSSSRCGAGGALGLVLAGLLGAAGLRRRRG